MTSLTDCSYFALDWIKKRKKKKEKCLHGQWLVKTEKRDKNSPTGGGWSKQRQWQADKQKRRKQLKIKISGTWKALAETMRKIKRERGGIQSALLVIGEAGGMGDGGSEKERRTKKEANNKGGNWTQENVEKLRNQSIENGNLVCREPLGVSLFSCFINFCTRRIMGHLEGFPSFHLK